MKIKLDENLPYHLCDILTQLGHDVDTVPQEGLTGKNDPTIWTETQKAKRFLITQDLDFSDTRQFKPGTHHGILLIRLQHPGKSALMQKIKAIFESENVDEWQSCFVIATDHKIRIRRPLPSQ